MQFGTLREGWLAALFFERSYGDRVRSIKVQLEDAVKPGGAVRLPADLGYDQEPLLPPKYNANVTTNEQLVDSIAGLLTNSGFGPEQIVSDYLEASQSLALSESQFAS